MPNDSVLKRAELCWQAMSVGAETVFNSWKQNFAIAGWWASWHGLEFKFNTPQMWIFETTFLLSSTLTSPYVLQISPSAAVAYSPFFQYCFRRTRTTNLLFDIFHSTDSAASWLHTTRYTNIHYHDLPNNVEHDIKGCNINLTFDFRVEIKGLQKNGTNVWLNFILSQVNFK